MKKTGIIVLSMLVLVSMVFAAQQKTNTGRLTTNKEVVLVPGDNKMVNQHQIMNVNPAQRQTTFADDGIHPVKTYSTGAEDVTRDCSAGDCWSLQHVGDDTQWYLGSGAAQDTFALAFTGAVPCIVQEAYIKWFDGGNITAFGALMSDEAAAATNGTGASVDQNNGIEFARSQAAFSPIGTLMTNPTPNTIEDYAPEFDVMLDLGGTFQVGSESDLGDTPPFVIVFVKGDATPHPLAADVFTGESYMWFGGPWTSDGTWGPNVWGSYQSTGSIANGLIDIAVQVRVTYPWGAPIAASAGILSNTYSTSDTRTVIVDLFDDVEDGVGIGGTDVVNFYYAVDGAIAGAMDLSDAVPVDVGADGNGLYGFDITYAAAAGSVVSYWLECVDNIGLASGTTEASFMVLAPMNPDADLLFIGDHSHQYYFNQFETIADELGFVYEYWDVLGNAGIHPSVINYGWENIFVYGWGNETIPIVAGEDDPGYQAFLDNGGDLLLTDMDWFYGHGLDSGELTFAAGDPAFDWFSLAGGTNDPDNDDNSANGGAGDTNIVSLIAGLPEQFFLNNGAYGTLNWTDFLTPDNATPIFQGYDTEEVVGTLYQDGGYRVNMSFMLDAIVDTTETGELYYHPEMADIVNYFLTLFDVATPPLVAIDEPMPGEYVFNDMGQTIYASGTDANGDAFTVDLYYNDGVSDYMIPMTDMGGGSFMATIPAQAGGTTVTYWPVATDVDGSYTGGSYSYYVYAPTADVLFVLNNEFDPAGYPGLYYFYNAAVGNLYVAPDFWTGGVVPELLEFYDTVFEVNTTNTWADFYYHYDDIAAWLATGDKNYFLAGDEFFGMILGWGNTEFMAGDFWYDMGVGYIYNDIGAGGTNELYAEMGNMISGDLYDGYMGMAATLLYDPEYEIGASNWLDGFDVANGAVPFLWDAGTDLPVGAYREWDNGSRTVILTADPLSINSDPYEWWGAHVAGPTIKSYDWFMTPGCPDDPGDVDLSTSIDILDVVMLVGYILGNVNLEECQMMNADANGDTGIDILDVVLIVNWILTGGPRTDNATAATIMQTEDGISFEANGYVGGIQLEIVHGENFSLTLGSALVAEYVTNGNTTTVIIINPESSSLAATSGEFQIVDVLVATTEGFIDASLNTPYEFALQPAYPNPFNPTTTIQFAVPQTTDINVVVFDMLGRQVAELAGGSFEAGFYSVDWNASQLSSGMYFVTFISSEFNATQKVMLVK
jgi:hypothetical protein